MGFNLKSSLLKILDRGYVGIFTRLKNAFGPLGGQGVIYRVNRGEYIRDVACSASPVHIVMPLRPVDGLKSSAGLITKSGPARRRRKKAGSALTLPFQYSVRLSQLTGSRPNRRRRI
jgi:hypothetical protein